MDRLGTAGHRGGGARHPANGCPRGGWPGPVLAGASLRGSRHARAGWRVQGLGRLVLSQLVLAVPVCLMAQRLALLPAGRPNAGRPTQGACLPAEVNVQPGCQVMRGGHGLRMQDNSYKVNRQTNITGRCGAGRALNSASRGSAARHLRVRWNYASRRSVALLRRAVITMLSVISKNLIVAAYIQSAAWVTCKMSRAAHKAIGVRGTDACSPGARGTARCVEVDRGTISGAGVRDAKACAQVPRR